MGGKSGDPESSLPSEQAEAAPSRLQRPARRAVYVTRIDTDGGPGHIVAGADYAVGASPAGKPRKSATDEAHSPSSLASDQEESAMDRWLRENVPPHW